MKLLKYNQFILENVQQAKSILAKLGLDTNNEIYKKIRTMLGDNLGYTGWFCKQHFENNVSLEQLQKLWSIIKNDKNLVSKLSKPIINFKTVDELNSELQQKINLTPAKLTLNKFYPEQKKLLDIEQDSELLITLSKNPKADKFFFNKSSRYHTRKELISAIKEFLITPQYEDYDDLLNQLQEDGQKIVFSSKQNNIIIIEVEHKDVVKWGGDTSWCIKNANSFKSYNSEALSHQFIIFLLDEDENYTKIGLTTNIQGWKASHLKNDNKIEQSDLDNLLKERGFSLDSLMPSKDEIKNLENFDKIRVKTLLSLGITVDEIMAKKKAFRVSDLSALPEKKGEMIKNLAEDLNSIVSGLRRSEEIQFSYDDLKLIAKRYCDISKITTSPMFATNYIVANYSRQEIIEMMKTRSDIIVDFNGSDLKLPRNRVPDLLEIIRPTKEEFSQKDLIDLMIYKESMRAIHRPTSEMISEITNLCNRLNRPLSNEDMMTFR
jgi:hypothetical protein